MFSIKEGGQLIELAIEAIKSEFSGRRLIVDNGIKSLFAEKQGVFVTLHKHKELRGCIGFPYPVYPLYQAVVEAAKAAAFSDPRFKPLSRSEMKDIVLEISVLTIPKKCDKKKLPACIKIGVDGLIVQRGSCSGLLLPQVATEYRWDARTFLEHTCMKAGFSAGAWKDNDARVYTFQAQIFNEEKGKITGKKF